MKLTNYLMNKFAELLILPISLTKKNFMSDKNYVNNPIRITDRNKIPQDAIFQI